MNDDNSNGNNPGYTPPSLPPSSSPSGGEGDTSVMSMKDWLITLLLMIIPCVNIVLLFVWAFGNGNQNKQNWARAYLIVMAIGIVLSIALSMFMGVAMIAMMDALMAF